MSLLFLRCLWHAGRQTGEDWVEWEEVGLQAGLAAVILWLQTEQREEDIEKSRNIRIKQESIACSISGRAPELLERG